VGAERLWGETSKRGAKCPGTIDVKNITEKNVLNVKNVKNVAEIKKTFENVEWKTLAELCSTFCLCIGAVAVFVPRTVV